MEQREDLTDHEDVKDCIITGLKEMYLSESLSDIGLQTAEKRFLCHRVVLASVSPYFKGLFSGPTKEAELREVCLPDVPSSILQTILNYVYTGEARLTMDNVEELFMVSSRLQIRAMQDLCSSYLVKRLDDENCLWIYRLAHSHNHGIFLEGTLNYIGRNLSSLSGTEDFFHLEIGELVNVLSSDDLMVSSELAVYDLARSWWEFRTQKDNPLPLELLKALRLPLLNPEELEKVSKDLPSDDSVLQPPKEIRLRRGMFEERILCVDTITFEETDPEANEDYHLNAYDPTTESWMKIPFCGFLENAGIASIGCYLFVSGGFRQERRPSNALHVYDSELNEWKELPPMTHPRACHGFLAYRNMLYAFGGHNNRRLLDSMECFSVLDNTWRNVAHMPLALHSFASAVLKGKLFAIGGMNGICAYRLHHKGFQFYDILTDTWSQFSLPVVFSGAGAVTVGDKLYVIAGHDPKHGDQEAYGPPNEKTKTICRSFCMDHLGRICDGAIPPVLASLAGSAVLRWKHRIYIMGGDGPGAMSHYTIFYWSPGEPKWTMCKKKIPFLFDGYGGITLQIPLKHLSAVIPCRKSDYHFKRSGYEEGNGSEERESGRTGVEKIGDKDSAENVYVE
ncbi:kelch-like protein 28 isoform X1 [Rana temporaria]|uniref:kelch-like protein 28 isoform X1 n=1 Tax=Rana temporaria TaxID=8407 RepID=UPI001AAD678C|nr:kelch-like protein 28 isoform X1 [Rana temporaria]